MPRREVVPPRTYSSTTSSGTEASVPIRPSSVPGRPAGTPPETSNFGSVTQLTCTFSGPRLHVPIVRISSEEVQRRERRIRDRRHGIRSPRSGRRPGAYSRRHRSARASRNRRRRSASRNEDPVRSSGGQRRRRRRMRPGEKALREIKHYQMTTELLLAKAPFIRVVRDIMFQESDTIHRMTLLSIEALQEAAEAFLIHVLEDAYLCTIHAKRKTLMLPDIKLACRLRNNYAV